jgi:predicted MFS family arabinose efflux permease
MAFAAIAAISLVVFVYRESHCEKPLLDLSIFQVKKFSLPVISMMLSFIATFMLSIAGPFFFQGALQYTPSQIGMLYLVTPAVMVVAAPLTGSLYDRTRSKYYAPLGMLIVAFTHFAFAMLALNFNLLLAIAIFIIGGLGSSLFQSPNNTEMMNALPARKLGISSSVSSTVRNLGMALGVSLSAILVSFQLNNTGYAGPILQAGTSLAPIVSNVMLAAGVLCIIAAVTSLARNV